MAGTENRHLAAGSGGAGAASDQPHARHWTNLALATGQCKAQAKTGRFLPRPGAILTPMGDGPGHPRLAVLIAAKTWMAGTRPAMTQEERPRRMPRYFSAYGASARRA